jgi:NTE family protein
MVAIEKSAGPKADLVLEGGGVKGIGLVGAALVLHERGIVFPRVAGTSAGAIVASLIAAHQVAGKPLANLETIMRGVDYGKFQDEGLVERLTGPPGEIAELLLHMGIAKGDYLVEWLGNVLADLGVETFADLAITDDDDPASSLPPERRCRLVVHTSDLSRGLLVRLPWDYPAYGLEPEKQRVVDAVRASMSIPFFFRPVTISTKQGHATWVDGGMLSNFPITVFDRTDGKPARWPTWGVKLSARPGSVQVDHATGNTFALALACLHTLLSGWDRYHLDDLHVTERTMFVDTAGVSSTDFGLTSDQQQLLYANGRAAATDFLARPLPAPAPAVTVGTPA